jgi:hypothetical protein
MTWRMIVGASHPRLVTMQSFVLRLFHGYKLPYSILGVLKEILLSNFGGRKKPTYFWDRDLSQLKLLLSIGVKQMGHFCHFHDRLLATEK